MVTVVAGITYVRGGRGRRRWEVRTTPDGWSGYGLRGSRDIDGILADARAGRVRRGWQVLRGEPWWAAR
ncbi:hypothetical protein GCM10010467_25470 [Actinocorallia glomerata]|uniref:Uncharacterized protein n=3 Tax=Actinomycetota TaxID=201174 RepID=A0ABP6LTB2_9MICC